MNATKYLKKAIEELSPKKKYPTNANEQRLLMKMNALLPRAIPETHLTPRELETMEQLVSMGMAFKTKPLSQEVNPIKTYQLTELGGREIAIMHGY